MSKNAENGSEMPVEPSSGHSVFDFLYNDSRRIASYLSQFEGGHLTQLVRSEEAGTSTSEQAGRDFSIGVTKVLGGGSKSSETEGVSAKEGLTRTFDPYWSNARTFLDYLSNRGLIERDIYMARMGQFVLVQGGLAVLDLASMQAVWGMPLFKQLLAEQAFGDTGGSGNRSQRRSGGKQHGADPLSGQPTIMRLAMELLPTFPHSTVACIIGDYWSTWSTLGSENLTGTASDLMLKHGNKIAGEWSMLGVLDAMPDAGGMELDVADLAAMGVSDQNMVATASLGLTPVVRMVAGRPAQSFGITPLLIFRQIASAVE